MQQNTLYKKARTLKNDAISLQAHNIVYGLLQEVTSVALQVLWTVNACILWKVSEGNMEIRLMWVNTWTN